MPEEKPLSDTQAHDRLHAALETLGNAPGKTERADTALEAARRALTLLSWGLVGAMENQTDEVKGIKPNGPEAP